jgi:hypothetical protein
VLLLQLAFVVVFAERAKQLGGAVQRRGVDHAARAQPD